MLSESKIGGKVKSLKFEQQKIFHFIYTRPIVSIKLKSVKLSRKAMIVEDVKSHLIKYYMSKLFQLIKRYYIKAETQAKIKFYYFQQKMLLQ